MGVDQYKGLLFLVSGVSVFVVMLLTLRLLALRSSDSSVSDDEDAWVGAEDLEIVDIVEETPDVKSFKLRRLEGKVFPPFRGGQFLSFQINGDPSVARSYSLSSTQQNREVVQVSVKRLEGGVGSNWFHQRRIGDHVKAFAPSGHFVDENEGAQARVFIAGGIGITPVFSMLISHLESARGVEIHLFYGARTQIDLAFHGMLSYLASRHEKFHYHPILSREPDWPGDKGRLTMDFILSKIGEVSDQYFYLCGPDPMVEPILDALDQSSLPEEHIFTEQFVASDAFDDSQIPEREVMVRWLGIEMAYKGRQNLLSFLEQQGQFLPSACRSGVCGSCKCRIEGDYTMLTKAGLTRQEQKQGYALACVSFPDADVDIKPIV